MTLHEEYPLLGQDSNKLSYYQLLGLETEADSTDIRTVYTALVQQYHPDRHKTLDANTIKQFEAAFAAIYDAYTTLSDPTARKAYDEQSLTITLPDFIPYVPTSTETSDSKAIVLHQGEQTVSFTQLLDDAKINFLTIFEKSVVSEDFARKMLANKAIRAQLGSGSLGKIACISENLALEILDSPELRKELYPHNLTSITQRHKSVCLKVLEVMPERFQSGGDLYTLYKRHGKTEEIRRAIGAHDHTKTRFEAYERLVLYRGGEIDLDDCRKKAGMQHYQSIARIAMGQPYLAEHILTSSDFEKFSAHDLLWLVAGDSPEKTLTVLKKLNLDDLEHSTCGSLLLNNDSIIPALSKAQEFSARLTGEDLAEKVKRLISWGGREELLKVLLKTIDTDPVLKKRYKSHLKHPKQAPTKTASEDPFREVKVICKLLETEANSEQLLDELHKTITTPGRSYSMAYLLDGINQHAAQLILTHPPLKELYFHYPAALYEAVSLNLDRLSIILADEELTDKLASYVTAMSVLHSHKLSEKISLAKSATEKERRTVANHKPVNREQQVFTMAMSFFTSDNPRQGLFCLFHLVRKGYEPAYHMLQPKLEELYTRFGSSITVDDVCFAVVQHIIRDISCMGRREVKRDTKTMLSHGHFAALIETSLGLILPQVNLDDLAFEPYQNLKILKKNFLFHLVYISLKYKAIVDKHYYDTKEILYTPATRGFISLGRIVEASGDNLLALDLYLRAKLHAPQEIIKIDNLRIDALMQQFRVQAQGGHIDVDNSATCSLVLNLSMRYLSLDPVVNSIDLGHFVFPRLLSSTTFAKAVCASPELVGCLQPKTHQVLAEIYPMARPRAATLPSVTFENAERRYLDYLRANKFKDNAGFSYYPTAKHGFRRELTRKFKAIEAIAKKDTSLGAQATAYQAHFSFILLLEDLQKQDLIVSRGEPDPRRFVNECANTLYHAATQFLSEHIAGAPKALENFQTTLNATMKEAQDKVKEVLEYAPTLVAPKLSQSKDCWFSYRLPPEQEDEKVKLLTYER